MSVDFNSPTWKYVEARIAEALDKQLAILTKPNTSYKGLLRAQGAVAILKTLKDMPREASLTAAK